MAMQATKIGAVLRYAFQRNTDDTTQHNIAHLHEYCPTEFEYFEENAGIYESTPHQEYSVPTLHPEFSPRQVHAKFWPSGSRQILWRHLFDL
ncbi:hypothetical protein AtubIFM57143_001467 [Aspergillus tubingensis]|nr:hypothetical protein AtubIFM57143_001467 [Aspergillus tubingensis]